MGTKKLTIAMNGITGRMGYRQHLVRSILPLREEGLELPDGTRTTLPLVARDGALVATVARPPPSRHGHARTALALVRAAHHLAHLHPAPVAHQSFPGKALELDELAHVVPGVLASRVASSISRISTSADALVARETASTASMTLSKFAFASLIIAISSSERERMLPVTVLTPSARPSLPG